MEKILIKNGMVCDPANDLFAVRDIFICEGRIEAVGEGLPAGDGVTVVDAEGLHVLPGLVDIHVHFRDPGQTHKEDVESGAAAAARGGVTSVLMMPNTVPPLGDPDVIRDLVRRGKDTKAHVYPVGCVTRGMAGKELVSFEELAAAGAAAFSEDGKSVLDDALLLAAMKETERLGFVMHSHCEDPKITNGGVMNDDENAVRLGLPGIPAASEEVITARDIALSKECGARLHICHVSTRGSVEMIRKAKAEGVRVTAETCPHYLILTSDDIPSDDANFKMSPPLRTPDDRAAVLEGLLDGTIDCVVTDHAPHSPEEKKGGFRGSPFGIAGIETSAALIYTELVEKGVLTLPDMVRKMSFIPAEIAKLPAGTLTPGAPADVAVFDFSAKETVDPDAFASRSRNTPFTGREVHCRTALTVCGGRIVYRDL